MAKSVPHKYNSNLKKGGADTICPPHDWFPARLYVSLVGIHKKHYHYVTKTLLTHIVQEIVPNYCIASAAYFMNLFITFQHPR